MYEVRFKIHSNLINILANMYKLILGIGAKKWFAIF